MSNPIQLKPWYKNSPLWPIPRDWCFKMLWEIWTFKTSSVDKVIVDWEKRVSLLNYMDVYRNRFIDSALKFSETSVNEREMISSNLKAWDIMFTPSSETPDDIWHSSVVVTDLNDTVFSYHLMRFRIDKENILDFSFRAYAFNNFLLRKEFFKKATWSTRYTLSKNDFEGSFVTFPESFVEQQSITKILRTTDESINLTQKIINKLEIRNKWLQQKLLTGKVRLKGFSEMGLAFLAIKSFAKEISEKNKDNQDLVVLSCTKYDGLVPSLEYFWRRIYSDDLTTYKVVRKNCFAYATNHIEEGSIWYQNKYDRALISPMYTVFKTNETIHDEYLFRLLKTHHSIHEYQKRMEGSIDRRGGLRWDEFSKIKVPVPSMEEQKAITNILDKASEELDLYEQKLEKLKQTKKWLMQQLLTGKVRVKLEK